MQFYWNATAGIWRNRQIVAKLDNFADFSATTPNEGFDYEWDESTTGWVLFE